jgi:hypothetical protein
MHHRSFSDGGGGGNSDTYYDSQSGLHLPVHNEKEIRLFLNAAASACTGQQHSTSSFVVPHHLYKDPDAGDVPNQLVELYNKGIRGVLLPSIEFPRDIRNLRSLTAIMSGLKDGNLQFFTLYDGDQLWQELLQTLNSNKQSSSSNASQQQHSMMIEFGGGSNTDATPTVENLVSRCVDEDVPTSLFISSHTISNLDPISLSNSVASLLDKYPGSCNTIWIDTTVGDDNDDSKSLSVIEELIYLDVAGPTIKSRLIVETFNEDLLEDIMFAGVNKFVVRGGGDLDDKDIERIQTIAADQGKSIVALS